MPKFEQYVDFDPEKDIPSLDGKVIFITGGTAGLGRQSALGLARHQPAHIYFTGRNVEAAKALINNLHEIDSRVGTTFIKMDMTSLADVKKACANFTHNRLDVLMCNAGVCLSPPAVSADGYENVFAINHLAHAMVIRELLPVLEKTATLPDSDVRVVSLTSIGWIGHPPEGITFATLRTSQAAFLGQFTRYSQSKLAIILYTWELSRRHTQSNIKFISVHPGSVYTDMITTISWYEKLILHLSSFFLGISFLEESQGRLSQLWAAAGAPRNVLVDGGVYYPIGCLSNDRLDGDKVATDPKLREELWTYTQDAIAKF